VYPHVISFLCTNEVQCNIFITILSSNYILLTQGKKSKEIDNIKVDFAILIFLVSNLFYSVAMAKRTKGKTMIYKTLHRKQQIEQNQEVVIDKHTIWKSGIIYHVNQGKIQIPADFSLKLDYIFIV
jgi:uncharacterized membrane protein